MKRTSVLGSSFAPRRAAFLAILPRAQARYLFSVLPASCRQNETVRHRKLCRRDAGSTLLRQSKARLNTYQARGYPQAVAPQLLIS